MELLDGRYELRELLGRGGMAEVHRARDRVLDREVAVKLLCETAPTDADTARHRFAAEARLLARLDHPGLVTLLGVGTSTGRPYFVMELVDGGTLSAHLTGTPLDPALVADIGAQVADALAHAHASGIVHRDVKPGNVLLAEDGRAKLADFGIARLLNETVGVTRTGNTVGTVAYLGPEQVRGEAVTPAVDVYALGLVLLEALTGTRAYPGTSTESAFARLHHSPTIPLSLPHGWPRLLAAMTATEPADRPDAAVAADALRSLAAGEPVAAALPAPDPTVEAPRTESVGVAPGLRRTSRHRLVLAGAAAVAATVMGVAAVSPDAAVSDERPQGPTTSEPATPVPGATLEAEPVSQTSEPQKAKERSTPTAEPSEAATKPPSTSSGKTRDKTKGGPPAGTGGAPPSTGGPPPGTGGPGKGGPGKGGPGKGGPGNGKGRG